MVHKYVPNIAKVISIGKFLALDSIKKENSLKSIMSILLLETNKKV